MLEIATCFIILQVSYAKKSKANMKKKLKTTYQLSFCSHTQIYTEIKLTLHPATIPSPPAHTMVVLTAIPHQSGWEQVAWSATGIKACCSLSAMGPPAKTHRQGLLASSTYTSRLSDLLYSISPRTKFTVQPKFSIYNFQLIPHACDFNLNFRGFPG